MNKMIFTMPGAQQLAENIADELNLSMGHIKEHIFPDGETLYRILDPVVGAHVYLVARLDNPNPKALQMLLLADGFRQQGAVAITLIAPYLPYMRQDTEFNPGEVISAKAFARVISERFDQLITLDPHLHRYESLDDLYDIPTTVVSATSPVARWIDAQTATPFIVGPDSESEQWVSKIAEELEAPFCTLDKVRKGDENVEIALPDMSIDEDRSIVLADDIISSGATLLRTIDLVKDQFPDRDIYCCATHCLATPERLDKLRSAGVIAIAATESVKNPISSIPITVELATSISSDRRLFC